MIDCSVAYTVLHPQLQKGFPVSNGNVKLARITLGQEYMFEDIAVVKTSLQDPFLKVVICCQEEESSKAIWMPIYKKVAIVTLILKGHFFILLVDCTKVTLKNPIQYFLHDSSEMNGCCKALSPHPLWYLDGTNPVCDDFTPSDPWDGGRSSFKMKQHVEVRRSEGIVSHYGSVSSGTLCCYILAIGAYGMGCFFLIPSLCTFAGVSYPLKIYNPQQLEGVYNSFGMNSGTNAVKNTYCANVEEANALIADLLKPFSTSEMIPPNHATMVRNPIMN
jgi:hypothetical protein